MLAFGRTLKKHLVSYCIITHAYISVIRTRLDLSLSDSKATCQYNQLHPVLAILALFPINTAIYQLDATVSQTRSYYGTVIGSHNAEDSE